MTTTRVRRLAKKGIVYLVGLEVVLMAICFGLFYAAPKQPVVRVVKVTAPHGKNAQIRLTRHRADRGLWPGLTNLFDYIDPRQAKPIKKPTL